MVTNKIAEEVKELTLGKLCRIVGIDLPKGFQSNLPITHVFSHHEQCTSGSAVFVTYYGSEYQSGTQALKRGAAIVFVRQEYKKKYFPTNEKVVGVENPKACTTRYLKHLRDLFPGKVVAVTGSIGKTTTVEMLRCVMNDAFVLQSHHSMTNSRDGILRTIQRMSPEATAYLQEVGGAEPGYVESSAKGLRPDVAIITNISESHLDLYKTCENILKDKAQLVENLNDGGKGILCLDNSWLREYKTQKPIVWFSLKNPEADYYAKNIRAEEGAMHFEICHKGSSESWPAVIHILGEHNVSNAVAVFAAGRQLGIPGEKIVASLTKYHPQGIRQNLTNIGGYKILLDTFNSDPNSIMADINALESIPREDGGRRIIILGDINRLGDQEKEIHMRVGREIATRDFDLLYCYGECVKDTYDTAKECGVKNIYYTDDRAVLDEWIRQNITPKDVTLYKSGHFGSQLSLTVDHVYGTTFYYNTQRIPTAYNSVHADFRTIGENLEFYRLKECSEERVIIPDGFKGQKVVRIAQSAFTRCRELLEVYIPDSVINIGSGAFYICPKLKDLHLPKDLKIIEDSAFNYCRALTALRIPEGTIHIGRRAFYDCAKLESLFVPDTVGYIGEEAFANCNNLTLTVIKGSYAEDYCRRNGLKYQTV